MFLHFEHISVLTFSDAPASPYGQVHVGLLNISAAAMSPRTVAHSSKSAAVMLPVDESVLVPGRGRYRLQEGRTHASKTAWTAD